MTGAQPTLTDRIHRTILTTPGFRIITVVVDINLEEDMDFEEAISVEMGQDVIMAITAEEISIQTKVEYLII
jgi:hypothetical protein